MDFLGLFTSLLMLGFLGAVVGLRLRIRNGLFADKEAQLQDLTKEGASLRYLIREQQKTAEEARALIRAQEKTAEEARAASAQVSPSDPRGTKIAHMEMVPAPLAEHRFASSSRVIFEIGSPEDSASAYAALDAELKESLEATRRSMEAALTAARGQSNAALVVALKEALEATSRTVESVARQHSAGSLTAGMVSEDFRSAPHEEAASQTSPKKPKPRIG